MREFFYFVFLLEVTAVILEKSYSSGGGYPEVILARLCYQRVSDEFVDTERVHFSAYDRA
jgi:hypothetical protein